MGRRWGGGLGVDSRWGGSQGGPRRGPERRQEIRIGLGGAGRAAGRIRRSEFRVPAVPGI